MNKHLSNYRYFIRLISSVSLITLGSVVFVNGQGIGIKSVDTEKKEDGTITEVIKRDSWINVRDFGASGSKFETTAETTAGSNVIVLKDIGDFKSGQQVTISKCNPYIRNLLVWDTPGGAQSYIPSTAEIEVRGYDGSLGNWTVFSMDFPGTDPPMYRWSDDMAGTWKESDVPVTGQWKKLSGGVEVKLGKRDWTKPCVITFHGRDELLTTILSIRGNKMALADPAPLGMKDCVVRHTDTAPLQAAFDKAVAQGRNIFIPSGHYRLNNGIILKNADGITVEGENEEQTILDISNVFNQNVSVSGIGPKGSEGVSNTACILIDGGTSVTLRNLRFQGFGSFAMQNEVRSGFYLGNRRLWNLFVKSCRAVVIKTPERVLIENCHARGMFAEAFYSQSKSRSGTFVPPKYLKSITYRNCTVADCAFNAFNNNDHAECTSILNCRIEDVGGNAWEGASRFVQFIGNYVRNAGPVAIGHIGGRDINLEILPSGQSIVANNTFELGLQWRGSMSFGVESRHSATPVIIKDNIFVNFNATAIATTGVTYLNVSGYFPSANTIISGNTIDLTCAEGKSRPRVGIFVSADETIVSDNQVYVRGEIDPNVTGIALTEPACDIVVHDNIIRGCATGLKGDKYTGTVSDVVDARTFKMKEAYRVLPSPRYRSHCYRGYRIAWLGAGVAVPGPVIEIFDPEECVFRFSQDTNLRAGAKFALSFSQGFNWNIHHNLINNCNTLVDLDIFGGPTGVLGDNLFSQGEAKNVNVAVSLSGVFEITGNRFTGFNGKNSVALLLRPDQFGKTPRLICRDNVFDKCIKPVDDNGSGMWGIAIKDGNVFGNKLEPSMR